MALIHGHSRNGGQSKAYTAWNNMRQRCGNSNHRDYPHYGGRGISVCARWTFSFEAFLADMGEPPEGMSLERENNALGYFPANCKWETKTVQASNTRRNVYVEYNGERMTQAEACRRAGLNVVSVKKRISRGWDMHAALHTPSARPKEAQS